MHDWLGRRFGDDLVFEAGRQARAGALEDYVKLFGKPLDQLEMDWHQALVAEYRAIPEVAALAARYRVESPIEYQRVCSEGVDF